VRQFPFSLASPCIERYTARHRVTEGGSTRMKRILVVGSSRPWGASTRRAAQMVGALLAQSNFGLVTGNVTGVDLWVARAFCATLKHSRRNESDYFSQISANLAKRRGSLLFLPFPVFRAGAGSRIPVKSFGDWIDEALVRSDAAIVIGGQRASLRLSVASSKTGNRSFRFRSRAAVRVKYSRRF
jgi:hypothetical protein